MKNITKKIASLFLVLIMTMSVVATPALAASKTYTTGGNGRTGVTFDLKTGSSSSERKLTFEQKKGTYAYQNVFTGFYTTNTYGRFCIHVQEVGGNAKAYYCDYKSGTTITLKANTNYRVSVVPTQNQFTYQHLLNQGKLKGSTFLGWNYGVGYWKTYPTFTISTKGAMSNVNSTTLSSSIY